MLDFKHPNFGDLLERKMYSTALLTYHFAIRISANYCLSFGPQNSSRPCDKLKYEYEKIVWSKFMGFDNAYHPTPQKFYRRDSSEKIKDRILAIQAGALNNCHYNVARLNCEHIARYVIGGEPYSHQVIVGKLNILGYQTNRYCWDLAKAIEKKIAEQKCNKKKTIASLDELKRTLL